MTLQEALEGYQINQIHEQKDYLIFYITDGTDNKIVILNKDFTVQRITLYETYNEESTVSLPYVEYER